MWTQPSSRTGIVIASTGRPKELGRWAEHVKRQTLPPTQVVYAVVKPTDLPENVPDNVMVIGSHAGLPIQRNAALEAIMER